MKPDFPVEQTVRARSSVRTYGRPVTNADKEKLMAYGASLSNPFGAPVSFHLLESQSGTKTQKLGTYGVIKGTKVFIGATVPSGLFSLEAVGYDFEKLILFATSLGIGTCWLAATFDRNAFTSAVGVKENEQFPAISPIGYPAAKKSITEALFRKTLKANQRKSWNELFFNESLSTPLTEAAAGEYALPLELLRLAPSASNKQPWRLVLAKGKYHFYAEMDSDSQQESPVVIQRVDIGIGASHFHLAALEKGLAGKFEKLAVPNITTPENLRYLFSWIPENQ